MTDMAPVFKNYFRGDLGNYNTQSLTFMGGKLIEIIVKNTY